MAARASTTTVIARCLQRLLVPIMRFCVRQGLRVQEITEASKVALIEAAIAEIKQGDGIVNISRLSVVTGLHRRDVMRIYRDEEIKDSERGVVPRLIGQWQNDKRLITKAGTPRVLDCSGDRSEFAEVVKNISGDLHWATILFELERIGAVERTSNGVKLMMGAYVPKGDLEEGFKILCADTEDLLEAVEENIFAEPRVPNLHARTEYDNVNVQALPKVREWLYKEGSQFHKRARKFISQFDVDVHPTKGVKNKGGKVVLGSFSRIINPKE